MDSINFDLFVVYRWLEVQEILVGELNSMISEENQKSNFMHLKKIIESRRKMSNKIFQFERFVVEFDNYSPFPDKPKFIPLKGNGDLFENLKTNIDEKMCIIKNMIRLFNEHSKQLLDLKNIEYNRNIQNLLLILAILALLISIIQFFGLKYSDIFQLFEKIKGII